MNKWSQTLLAALLAGSLAACGSNPRTGTESDRSPPEELNPPDPITIRVFTGPGSFTEDEFNKMESLTTSIV